MTTETFNKELKQAIKSHKETLSVLTNDGLIKAYKEKIEIMERLLKLNGGTL